MAAAPTATPAAWSIGATVRVGVPASKKRTRRAMIATLNDDDTSASLLWESALPRPLSDAGFLVTPWLSDDEEDSAELEVPLNALQSLLPFEQHQESSDEETTPASWKERGDALLQLGDAGAAVSYYEYALLATCPRRHHHHKHTPTIGASILVKTKAGFIQVAEVDCLNEEDESMDITWVTAQSGEEEEACIPQSRTLLTVLEPDHVEHLQERILLNLTRALLQLAQSSSSSTTTTTTTTVSSSSRHGVAYAKAAVVASSLALALGTLLESDRTTTARLLRSKAQGARQYYPQALQDVNHILQSNSGHEPALKLRRVLQTEQARLQRRDKVLARRVCQWVAGASSSPAPGSSGGPAVLRRTKYDKDPSSSAT
jgi:hypothetical protein